MQIQYRFELGGAQVMLTCEAGDSKEAFEVLSRFSDMFGHSVCGHCRYKGETHPVVRQVDAHGKRVRYYEITCDACKHSLKFGVLQDGTGLFPKRWEPPYSGPSQSEAEESGEAKASGPPEGFF